VVNALKSLERSLVYGEEVTRLLQASPVWSQYEQQRHDLFIQVTRILCQDPVGAVLWIRNYFFPIRIRIPFSVEFWIRIWIRILLD
jgi:hypothetical protein